MTTYIRRLRDWRFNSEHDVEGTVEMDSSNNLAIGSRVKITNFHSIQEFPDYWRVSEKFSCSMASREDYVAVYILPKEDQCG